MSHARAAVSGMIAAAMIMVMVRVPDVGARAGDDLVEVLTLCLAVVVLLVVPDLAGWLSRRRNGQDGPT